MSPLTAFLIVRDLEAVVFLFLFLFIYFWLFRATPVAYGGSQTRGRIKATAALQHHSHSKTRPEPRLGPTPQLTAAPDP